MTDIIKELEERGYIEQLTHEEEIRKPEETKKTKNPMKNEKERTKRRK